MLLQFIYTLSGNNLIALEIILAAIALLYLVLIFHEGVSIGIFGNIVSCLAGIVSPLSAAFAVSTGVFKLLFMLRFMIEMALIILAAVSMMGAEKKRPLGIVIILGNYLFFSIIGTMIPLGMQNPDYWIKTTLAVGAFGLFLLSSGSKGSVVSHGSIVPPVGPLVRSLYGNDYDNDGLTAYDKGTGRSYHYSLGNWYDQDGNMIPSASASAWGLDDYYDKYIAGHDLVGRMPYGSK